jgi:hypothetical protein
MPFSKKQARTDTAAGFVAAYDADVDRLNTAKRSLTVPKTGHGPRKGSATR